MPLSTVTTASANPGALTINTAGSAIPSSVNAPSAALPVVTVVCNTSTRAPLTGAPDASTIVPVSVAGCDTVIATST